MAAGALSIFALVPVAEAQASRAAATVVIYNKNDRDSRELARFYAEKRGIPNDQLVALDCPVSEEISREQYDNTIADPLRETFVERGWWILRDEEDPERGLSRTKMRYAAVIKGVPLKIRGASDYPGDKASGNPVGSRNEASVDSELVVLGRFSDQISGAQTNVYYKSYRTGLELPDPSMLLVSRLDAADAETVRRMITDSVAVEKSGLWGRAYIDGANNQTPGFAIGDGWLKAIVGQLRKAGVPVVYDNEPSVFPAAYPISDCALYYGWYTGGVTGPFAEPTFRFLPGAVAVHIHSFSADTLRNAGANWVAPLLARGAAASLGNVYEPYLQLTPELDIFNDRLVHGMTLAESAYMSLRATSWMTVVVGDPLYRPYAAWVQLDSRGGGPWRVYHDFAVKNRDKPEAEYRKLARQVASRANSGAMLEDLGLAEAEAGNTEEAISYFQQARATYTKRDDILRVVLHETNALTKIGRQKRALELVRSVLRIVSDPAATQLLQNLEQHLSQSQIGSASQK